MPVPAQLAERLALPALKARPKEGLAFWLHRIQAAIAGDPKADLQTNDF